MLHNARKLSAGVVAAGLAVMAVALSAQAASPRPTNNPPWYPSLQAFEHYDSGRSHVFSTATFGGSFDRPEPRGLVASRKGAVPVRLQHVLPQREGGLHPGRQLRRRQGLDRPVRREARPGHAEARLVHAAARTRGRTGEWDYPGAMAIENDGFIYVVSGYRIFKVDPANGKVVKTLKLPTLVYMRSNYPETPAEYDHQPDRGRGQHLVQRHQRAAGRDDHREVAVPQWPGARCTGRRRSSAATRPRTFRDPSWSPSTRRPCGSSTTSRCDAFAGARPTITRYHGVDYVYLLENTSERGALLGEARDVHPRHRAGSPPRSLLGPDDRRLVDRHERLDRRRDEHASCRRRR